jgi:hypothetical protein
MTKLADASFQNARENRDDTARWLAVEVLLANPAVLEDDELADRLLALQDRLEAVARVRYGLSGEPSGQASPAGDYVGGDSAVASPVSRMSRPRSSSAAPS